MKFISSVLEQGLSYGYQLTNMIEGPVLGGKVGYWYQYCSDF